MISTDAVAPSPPSVQAACAPFPAQAPGKGADTACEIASDGCEFASDGCEFASDGCEFASDGCEFAVS
eukprot:3524087-Pyramimonas_sp.AAC.1